MLNCGVEPVQLRVHCGVLKPNIIDLPDIPDCILSCSILARAENTQLAARSYGKRLVVVLFTSAGGASVFSVSAVSTGSTLLVHRA